MSSRIQDSDSKPPVTGNRIGAIAAKYRDGRDDAEALEAAAHDILVLLEILDNASRTASAGLDHGSLRETVKNLFNSFELPRE